MGHSQTIGTNSTAFEMRGHSPSPSFSCGRSKQQSQDLMAAIRVVEEHPQTDNALNCALAQAIRYIYFEDDILNVRCRTTGITSKVFSIQNARLNVFDVGGQKSERKKWLALFADVKAVIFVVALSSYNEVMYEDSRCNYMDDALEIFEETMNHRSFIRMRTT